MIIINGGIITAEASRGAGIGGGYADRKVDNNTTIIINDGIITARSSNGAGIGSNRKASGSNVTIHGGEITAVSINEGSGIGGSQDGYCGTVIINGGTVEASSGAGAVLAALVNKAILLLSLKMEMLKPVPAMVPA